MLNSLMLSVLILNVLILNVLLLSALMPSVLMLSVIMLIVRILSVLLMSVDMLSVIMLSVVTQSVLMQCPYAEHHYAQCRGVCSHSFQNFECILGKRIYAYKHIYSSYVYECKYNVHIDVCNTKTVKTISLSLYVSISVCLSLIKI
jgi:hypothetical protein